MQLLHPAVIVDSPIEDDLHGWHGWHALRYSEGRESLASPSRPSEYLRACHPTLKHAKRWRASWPVRQTKRLKLANKTSKICRVHGAKRNAPDRFSGLSQFAPSFPSHFRLDSQSGRDISPLPRRIGFGNGSVAGLASPVVAHAALGSAKSGDFAGSLGARRADCARFAGAGPDHSRGRRVFLQNSRDARR
jgi:hypothetical protein